jgi:hypothetical protein
MVCTRKDLWHGPPRESSAFRGNPGVCREVWNRTHSTRFAISLPKPSPTRYVITPGKTQLFVFSASLWLTRSVTVNERMNHRDTKGAEKQAKEI